MLINPILLSFHDKSMQIQIPYTVQLYFLNPFSIALYNTKVQLHIEKEKKKKKTTPNTTVYYTWVQTYCSQLVVYNQTVITDICDGWTVNSS